MHAEAGRKTNAIVSKICCAIVATVVLALWFTGAAFAHDLTAKFAKLGQKPADCEKNYDNSHDGQTHGKNKFPGMPLLTYNSTFWVALVTGLVSSIIVQLVAWVMRGVKWTRLGGRDRTEDSLSVDNFISVSKTSIITITFGFLATMLGIVSGNLWFSWLTVEPYQKSDHFAKPQIPGNTGNPYLMYRTYDEVLMKKDLEPYEDYKREAIGEYMARENLTLEENPWIAQAAPMNPTEWAYSLYENNNPITSKNNNPPGCIECPITKKAFQDGKLVEDLNGRATKNWDCGNATNLDNCGNNKMKQKRLVENWVYLYRQRRDINPGWSWCGQHTSLAYGVEFFVAQPYLIDAMLGIVDMRNDMFQIFKDINFWTSALACLIGMFQVYSFTVPHQPHDMLMLSTFFRWCRLFSVATTVSSLVKSKVAKYSVIVFRLVCIIFAFAVLISVAEWPCDVIVRESDMEGSFYLNTKGNCDSAFQSMWTCIWFIFVTMSTVGYGDHSPHTIFGQGITILLIMVMLTSLPGWIDDLSNSTEEEETTVVVNPAGSFRGDKTSKAVVVVPDGEEQAIEYGEDDEAMTALREACAVVGMDLADKDDPKLAMVMFVAAMHEGMTHTKKIVSRDGRIKRVSVNPVQQLRYMKAQRRKAEEDAKNGSEDV